MKTLKHRMHEYIDWVYVLLIFLLILKIFNLSMAESRSAAMLYFSFIYNASNTYLNIFQKNSPHTHTFDEMKHFVKFQNWEFIDPNKKEKKLAHNFLLTPYLSLPFFFLKIKYWKIFTFYTKISVSFTYFIYCILIPPSPSRKLLPSKRKEIYMIAK